MRDYRDVKKRLSALLVCGLLVFTNYGSDFITIAEGENTCGSFMDVNSWDAEGNLIVDEAGNSVPDGICDLCGRDAASHVTPAAEPEEDQLNEADLTEGAEGETQTEQSGEAQQTEAGQGENELVNTCNHVDENEDGLCDVCQADLTAPEEATSEDEKSPENSQNEEIPNENTIEVEEEVIVEGLEDCEHEFSYVNNGDGTHSGACTKCERFVKAPCVPNEDGLCYFCGQKVEISVDEQALAAEPELVDPATCTHDYIYFTNEDGTHTFACIHCQTEGQEECSLNDAGFCAICGGYYEAPKCEHEYEYESDNEGHHTAKCKLCEDEFTEDCVLDENGYCLLCNYYEEPEVKLVDYNVAKAFPNVTVRVTGELPEGMTIDIRSISPTYAEHIINESIRVAEVDALGAYDINIYDQDGNIYQPCWDDQSVRVSFEGFKGLNGEKVTVYRIQDDKSVDSLPTTEANGVVSCETDHFTIITPTVATDADDADTFYSYQHIGYIATSAADYTRVKGTEFNIKVPAGETVTYNAYLCRDLTVATNPESGTKIAEVSGSVSNAGADDAWFTEGVDFTTDASYTNGYLSKGKTYSVYIVFGSTVYLAYGKYTGASGTNTYVLRSSYGAEVAYNGILSAEPTKYVETNSEPDGLTNIEINSTEKGRKVASDSGKYVYYTVGETDKLLATLTPNLDRKIKFEKAAGGSANVDITEDGVVSATGPGTAVVTATYGSGANKKQTSITVTFLEINLYDKSGNIKSSFGYSADNIEPTVKVTDGVTEYTTGNGSSLGTPTYSNNKAASNSAKVTAPFTAHNATYQLEKTFTITPYELDWSTSFNTAKFTVNTATDKVESVTSIVSPLAKEVIKFGTHFDVTLSNKTITAGTITYTATIKSLSDNYSVSALDNSGTVTVDTSTKDINDFVELRWNGSEPSYEYKAKAYDDAFFGDWAKFKFYYKGTNTEAAFITKSNTTFDYINTKDKTDTAKISVTVTGYDSEKPLVLNFKIYEKEITNNNEITVSWLNGKNSFIHTGNPIEPHNYSDGKNYFVVTFNDGVTTESLVYDKDYTVSYTLNTDIGTATAKINGKGNYTGYKATTFEIEGDFEKDSVIWVNQNNSYKASSGNGFKSNYSEPFTGSAITPDVYVYLGGLRLSKTASGNTSDGYYITHENEDGTVADATAGTKKIVCHGTGKYDGMVCYAYYTIERVKLTNAKVVFTLLASGKTKNYTGDEIKLQAGTDYTLKFDNSYDLKAGEDYEITYSSNLNAGTATFLISAIDGKGNFTGSYPTKDCEFTINPIDINDGGVTVTPDYTETTFDDTEKTPGVTITYSGKQVPSTNYGLSYSNNKAAGTATIHITGTGNLTGTRDVTFEIKKKGTGELNIFLGSVENPVVTDAKGNLYCAGYNPKYTGNKNIPTVIIKDGTKTLTSGSDYEYDILNNVNVNDYATAAKAGTTALSKVAYVSIVFKGSYGDSASETKIYFDIAPRDINDTTLTIPTTIEWDGSDRRTKAEGDITLVDNGSDLKKKNYKLVNATDYTLNFTGQDYTTSGEDKPVTIEGKGNYTGTIEAKFNIGYNVANIGMRLYKPNVTTNPISATTTEYSGVNRNYTVDFNGEYTPYEVLTMTLLDSTNYTMLEGVDKDNVSGKDYYVTYDSTNSADIYNSYNNTNVVEATIHGVNGFYGETTFKYTIKGISLVNLTMKSSIPADSYGLYIEADNNVEYTGDVVKVSDQTKIIYGYNMGATPGAIVVEVYTFNMNSAGTDDYGNEYIFNVTSNKSNKENEIGPELGSYTVKVSAVNTGKGNLQGTKANLSYTIVPRPLTSANVTVTVKPGTLTWNATKTQWEAFYTGEKTKLTGDDFTVKLKHNNQELVYGTDYEIIVESSSIGPAVAYISGKSELYRTQDSSKRYKFDYEIVTVSMDKFDEATVNGIYTYTGAQIKPTSLNVVYNGRTLVMGTDYTIKGYGTNIFPGQGERTKSGVSNGEADTGNYVEIEGMGTFAGTLKVPFAITLGLGTTYAKVTFDKDVTNASTYYEIGDVPVATVKYNYNGKDITINLSASPTENNYSVAVSNPSVPGKQTVSVTGTSNGRYDESSNAICSGTYTYKNVRFLADLSKNGATYFKLKNGVDTFPYTGSAVDLVDGTYLSNNTLIANYGLSGTMNDYIAQCTDNNNVASNLTVAGPKKITITGSNNSSYYVPGSTYEIPYYVKYNLDSGNLYLWYNNQKVTKIEYTGGVITHDTNSTNDLQIRGEFGATKDLVTLSQLGYVKIDTNGYTIEQPGIYPIKVVAENTDYVMGGPVNLSLEIEGKKFDTNEISVVLPVVSYTYTGSEIKPEPTVSIKSNGEVLIKNKDYKVTWESCTNAGTAYAIVTGFGAYSGNTPISVSYTINKKNVNDTDPTQPQVEIQVSEVTYAGNEKEVTPEISAVYNSIPLTEGADYTLLGASKVLYANVQQSTGQYTLDFGNQSDPTGNFYGTKTGTYTINKYNLSTAQVIKVKTSCEFTNKVITNAELKDKLQLQISEGVDLVQGSDYDIDVKDENGANANNLIKSKQTYIISVIGKNNCTGDIQIQFTVTARSIPKNWAVNGSGGTISISTYKQETFTEGVAVEPKAEDITITDTGFGNGTYTLVPGKDYEIVGYGNNDHAGGNIYSTDTATMEYGNYIPAEGSPYMVIRGMGDYEEEEFKVAFCIGKDINDIYKLSNVNISGIAPALTYNGAEQIPTPEITYTNSSGGTSKFKSFTTEVVGVEEVNNEVVLTPNDAVSAGTKRLIIKGTGAYYGSLENKISNLVGANKGYFTYQINTRSITQSYSLKGSFNGKDNYVYEGNPDTQVSQLTLNEGLTFKLNLEKLDQNALNQMANKEVYEDYEGYYYFEYNGASYDGESDTLKEFVPTVTVYDNGLAIKNKVVDESNYKAEAKNANASANVNGNLFSYIEVTMQKNYTVYETPVVFRIYYIITQNNITATGFEVTFDDKTNVFPWDDGNAVTPKFKVKNDSGKELSFENDEYEYEFSNNIKPGKATLTVKGLGNYAGTITKDFYIRADISDCTVVTPKRGKVFDENDSTTYVVVENGQLDDQFYTGEEIKPVFKVILEDGDGRGNNVLLTEDVDYEVKRTSKTGTWSGRVDVTLTGKGRTEITDAETDETYSGDYGGTRDDLFFMITLNPELIEIGNYKTTYEYTSIKILPKFSFETDGNQKLDESLISYEVNYYRLVDGKWKKVTEDELVECGTIRAIFTFSAEGVDSVDKEASYTIVPRSLENITYVHPSVVRYTGKKAEPLVSMYIVTDDGKVVYIDDTNLDQNNTDRWFNIDYSVYENKYPDTTCGFVVSVNDGKNTNFTGSKTCNFIIEPGQPSGISTEPKSSTEIEASWVKDRFSTGTIVECFEYTESGSTKLVERAKITGKEYTFKDLTASSSYYIQFTSYVEVDTDGDGVKTIFKSASVGKKTTTGVDATTISLTSPSTGKTLLTWEGGNVASYYIYRSTDQKTWIKVATLPSTTQGYSDASLESNKTYYYYVVSYILVDGVLVEGNTSRVASVNVK